MGLSFVLPCSSPLFVIYFGVVEMINEERKRLIEEIIREMCFMRAMPACNCALTGKCKAPIENFQYTALPDQARAVLAIVERRIREDCASIAYQETYEGFVGKDGLEKSMSDTSQGYDNAAWNIYNKILASIPE